MAARRGGPFAPMMLAAALIAVGCSDDTNEPTVSAGPTTTAVATSAPAGGDPRVDLIDDAIAAVTAEVGGAPEFYEINATALLVNLFVAGPNGTVTPYVFVEGDLSSQPTVDGASGGTFPGSSVQFNADTILDGVRAELPTSLLEVMFIQGNGTGAVQYTIGTQSDAGAPLLVIVEPDGTVVSLDAGG